MTAQVGTKLELGDLLGVDALSREIFFLIKRCAVKGAFAGHAYILHRRGLQMHFTLVAIPKGTASTRCRKGTVHCVQYSCVPSALAANRKTRAFVSSG